MLLRIIWIVIWVAIIAIVVKRAAVLGRSQLGWGIFAAFIPVVAIIIIFLIKQHHLHQM